MRSDAWTSEEEVEFLRGYIKRFREEKGYHTGGTNERFFRVSMGSDARHVTRPPNKEVAAVPGSIVIKRPLDLSRPSREYWTTTGDPLVCQNCLEVS